MSDFSHQPTETNFRGSKKLKWTELSIIYSQLSKIISSCITLKEAKLENYNL